jgi:acetolactate synthase-1/2/3 large subunit
MSELTAALANALLQEGVQFAFGISGSGPSLALITQLERGGARYYDVPHEAAGAIMAGTVARWTCRPAVSVSIKGPGLANMLPGIAHNYFESNPAISVSEAFSPSVSLARQHKRMDQRGVIGPFVKSIAGASDETDRLRGYIRAAVTEAPGPVHFELAQGIDSDPLPQSAKMTRDEHKLDEVLQRIRRATRPVIIAGQLGARRSWRVALPDLRVPVFTTAAAKGLVDEKSAFAAGVYTGDGKAKSPEARILPLADLVVCLGVRDTEILSPWARTVEVVGLDEVEGSCGFPFSRYHSVASRDDFDAVLAAFSEKEWGAEEVCHSRAELFSAMASQEWQPFHCFRALQTHEVKLTLVSDTGSFCTIAEHAWAASADSPYMGSSNGRYMGVGLPTAVAIALCDRDRPVICAVGDGGIRTYPALFKFIVEEQLDLCVVLMRDSHYGSIACAAPSGSSVRALRIAQASWVSTVEGMGIRAAAAEHESAFEQTISQWNRKGPFFIEAVFDTAVYQKITEGVR